MSNKQRYKQCVYNVHCTGRLIVDNWAIALPYMNYDVLQWNYLVISRNKHLQKRNTTNHCNCFLFFGAIAFPISANCN